MKTTLPAVDLLERDQAHLIHPLHDSKAHQTGHVWIRGEGALLFDAAGKEYIDGLSGLWNVVLGHGRRELADAASDQMRTLAFCSGYTGSTHPPAIRLAERLARLTYPSINHFFFTSGGAESTETAIKVARSYWKLRGKERKTKVISRQWGYHGVTLAAMSATGIGTFWPLFEPRVPGFVHIPAAYPYRTEVAAGTTPAAVMADALEQAVLREGPETVAMFLAEPVAGAGGVIVPPDDYFPLVREICTKYDVLLVADEVITGFGRTGKWFGLQHWGVEPDIMQFAKAITSGYVPFGGVGVNDAIMDAIDRSGRPWMHAFTYSAHPVGCAVALRTIQIIEEENLVTQAGEKGAYLLDALRLRLSGHAHVGDVRGLGLMCGVEFVKDKATKAEFPPEEQVGLRVHAETQKRGLFSRLRGDNLLLAPPFVTPYPLLDRIADIMADSTRAVLGS